MAELVERRDLTDPSQHGWALDYLIRRDDGEESMQKFGAGRTRMLRLAGRQTRTLSRPSRIEASRPCSNMPRLWNRHRNAAPC